MKRNIIYNGSKTYYNINADFGFDSTKTPATPLFAVREGEDVCVTEVGGEKTLGEVYPMLDRVDLAIITENARSKYITSLQLYQFLALRGFKINREAIKRRMKKLVKLEILRKYEIRKEGDVSTVRYYGLTNIGVKIAMIQKVDFNMGNRVVMDVVDDVETVKRILAANMVILGLLRNGVDIEGFGFNETIRASQAKKIMDDCILRTPGMFWMDEASIFLVEVIRSTPHAFDKLADKIQRYYALVNNPDYLKANVHGHKTMPQFVICAETFEDSCEIDAFLRSKGLWSEADSILYTYDLIFMKDTLNVFYELKEDGTPIWYCLPSRYNKERNFCA